MTLFAQGMKSRIRILVIAIVFLLGVGALGLFLGLRMRNPVEANSGIAGSRVKAAEVRTQILEGLDRRLHFRPEIRISGEKESPVGAGVFQFTASKRDFAYDFQWEQRWAGTSKRIKMRGFFTAIAGYDLHPNFFLDINPENLRVDLTAPEPRLLECVLNDHKPELDDGVWNKLSEEEKTRALNDMVTNARRAIQEDKNLLTEAKRMLEQQMVEVIAESGGSPGNVNDQPFSKY